MSACACGRSVIYTGTGECGACYRRRHRRENPEMAERDRSGSRAWKDRHREANRARDRRHAAETRVPCSQDCGGLMQSNAAMCAACVSKKSKQRDAKIVEMYEAGVPIAAMAEALGTTTNSLGTAIDRLRKAGRIGYRHAGYGERAA